MLPALAGVPPGALPARARAAPRARARGRRVGGARALGARARALAAIGCARRGALGRRPRRRLGRPEALAQRGGVASGAAVRVPRAAHRLRQPLRRVQHGGGRLRGVAAAAVPAHGLPRALRLGRARAPPPLRRGGLAAVRGRAAAAPVCAAAPRAAGWAQPRAAAGRRVSSRDDLVGGGGGGAAGDAGRRHRHRARLVAADRRHQPRARGRGRVRDVHAAAVRTLPADGARAHGRVGAAAQLGGQQRGAAAVARGDALRLRRRAVRAPHRGRHRDRRPARAHPRAAGEQPERRRAAHAAVREVAGGLPHGGGRGGRARSDRNRAVRDPARAVAGGAARSRVGRARRGGAAPARKLLRAGRLSRRRRRCRRVRPEAEQGGRGQGGHRWPG